MDYTNWKKHFQNNITHFDHINWERADHIDQKEIRLISKSIQQFQKGENSEGKNLIQFAKQSTLNDYLETITLFIREEQRHAAVLGKFMDRHGIPRIRKHWVDNVFRWLRKLSALENSIIVLSSAEIISTVYYIGLHNATKSPILRDICRQILVDEENHINFQAYTLQYYFNKRSKWGKRYILTYHWVLMNMTCLVVWFFHSSVFRAGGIRFRKFYRLVFMEFNRAYSMIMNRDEKIERPRQVSLNRSLA